jgi:hypothetical protein
MANFILGGARKSKHSKKSKKMSAPKVHGGKKKGKSRSRSRSKRKQRK